MAFDYDAFNTQIQGLAESSKQTITPDSDPQIDYSMFDPYKYYKTQVSPGPGSVQYAPLGGDDQAKAVTAFKAGDGGSMTAGIEGDDKFQYTRAKKQTTSGGYATAEEGNLAMQQAKTAEEAYNIQKEALGGQANKAGMALGLKGEHYAESMEQLDALSTELSSAANPATALWASAIEKADEFVTAGIQRTADAVKKLEDMNAGFMENQQTAKAHDMQVAVQSTLGTMNAEGRGILERYGAESAEYAGYMTTKSQTLATLQSSIHSTYQQIRNAQNTTLLNAVSQTTMQHNMYTNYHEQQAVQTRMAAAQAEETYGLQVAQLQITAEQLKLSVGDDMANWIIGTPEFTSDLQPLMAFVADTYSGLGWK